MVATGASGIASASGAKRVVTSSTAVFRPPPVARPHRRPPGPGRSPPRWRTGRARHVPRAAPGPAGPARRSAPRSRRICRSRSWMRSSAAASRPARIRIGSPSMVMVAVSRTLTRSIPLSVMTDHGSANEKPWVPSPMPAACRSGRKLAARVVPTGSSSTSTVRSTCSPGSVRVPAPAEHPAILGDPVEIAAQDAAAAGRPACPGPRVLPGHRRGGADLPAGRHVAQRHRHAAPGPHDAGGQWQFQAVRAVADAGAEQVGTHLVAAGAQHLDPVDPHADLAAQGRFGRRPAPGDDRAVRRHVVEVAADRHRRRRCRIGGGLGVTGATGGKRRELAYGMNHQARQTASGWRFGETAGYRPARCVRPLSR